MGVTCLSLNQGHCTDGIFCLDFVFPIPKWIHDHSNSNYLCSNKYKI